MDTGVRSMVLSALAFTAGAMLVAMVNSPTAAVAQSPAPAPELGSQIKELQRQVRYLYGECSSLRQELRRLSQGGGQGQKLDAKVKDLEQKLTNHTHDVLQEGRAADGSLRQVDQSEFGRSGLNSTGAYRVGKAKF